MKILTRPNDKAIFLIAAAGALLAGMALFLVPPSALNAGGETQPVASGAASRPASGPASRPVSRPAALASNPSGLLAPSNFPTQAYAGLLRKALQNGRVDYAGLKQHPDELKALVRAIETTDPVALQSLDKASLTAWYANAYNLLTLDLIVRHFPLASIMDIHEPWDTPMTVAGQPMTLNEIEHDVLRMRNEPDERRRAFVDPRIHFALNCASIGCPDLQPTPFAAAELDRQLDEATRDFVKTPAKFRVENGTWYLSQLMDWYGDDFLLLHPGSTKAQALGLFFADYVEEPLAGALRSGELEIEWLEYDWELNGADR